MNIDIDDLNNFVHKKIVNLPGAQPWRIMSSEIATRRTEEFPHKKICDEQIVLKNNCLSNLEDIPLTDALRTPYRRSQSKSNIGIVMGCDSRMTKNCEALISHIMKNNTPRPRAKNTPIEPASLSVRKIIKSSGLLKAFSTGFLEKEESSKSAQFTALNEDLRLADSPIPVTQNLLLISESESWESSPQSSPESYHDLESKSSAWKRELTDTNKSETNLKSPLLVTNQGLIQTDTSAPSTSKSYNRKSKVTFVGDAPSDKDPIPLYSVYHNYYFNLDEPQNESAREDFCDIFKNTPVSYNCDTIHQQGGLGFDAFVIKKTIETEVMEYEVSNKKSRSGARLGCTVRKRTMPKQCYQNPNKSKSLRSGYEASSETESNSQDS